MAFDRLSTTDLRSRLQELHEETAPRAWGKTQLLLRLVELEGPGILEKAPADVPPLRQAEIMINKASRKKSQLVDLMQNQMNMTVNGNETIEQLKVKALNEAYAQAPAHAKDPVGFGAHAAKSYEEVAMEAPSYLEWAITTMKEGPCCPRLKRLAEWGETAVGQLLMAQGKGGRQFQKKKTGMGKVSKPSASSSNVEAHQPSSDLMVDLAKQVETLTKELKDLKSQKARKTRSEGEEISSSDWDKMSSAPSAA
eukprot:s442_g18.t1